MTIPERSEIEQLRTCFPFSGAYLGTARPQLKASAAMGEFWNRWRLVTHWC